MAAKLKLVKSGAIRLNPANFDVNEYLVDEDTQLDWIDNGVRLSEIERQADGIYWIIGDWWNRGEKYGDRVDLAKSPDWRGPALKTLRNLGYVAKRFPEVSRRRDTLSFHHFESVAALPPEAAERMLNDIEAQLALGEDVPRNVVRNTVKAEQRAIRESKMVEPIQAAAAKLPTMQRYGVILADPPWRFDVWSRDTGLDRAPDNHYPTMTLDEIIALKVPAADNCVLFLWATAPRLPEALDVMRFWGFDYKSHLVWTKPQIGTGYWCRSMHELLLIGTRGDVPAPSPGTQSPSVLSYPRGRHSAKPEEFRRMIEGLFPTTPKVELFAREAASGWDAWGAEA